MSGLPLVRLSDIRPEKSSDMQSEELPYHPNEFIALQPEQSPSWEATNEQPEKVLDRQLEGSLTREAANEQPKEVLNRQPTQSPEKLSGVQPERLPEQPNKSFDMQPEESPTKEVTNEQPDEVLDRLFAQPEMFSLRSLETLPSRLVLGSSSAWGGPGRVEDSDILDGVVSKVLEVITMSDEAKGVHIDDIVAQVRAPMMHVLSAVARLVDEAEVFTTIDDQHFSV